MPVTRSATRAAAGSFPAVNAPIVVAEPKKPLKRKAASVPAAKKETRKKAKADVSDDNDDATLSREDSEKDKGNPSVNAQGDAAALVPAVLTFSFEDAKEHLISADCRFEEMFKRMPCKPFEHLEQFDPFRTLANSIMGQQISWLAARAIIHKFIRLFDPSLPEKPVDHSNVSTFFPTAHQVSEMDLSILRTAGLSGRKAEYIHDLASRFSDGRLSTQKLLEANDEDLYDMLIEVKGIGRWTVDMFALFSLRRPDILPVGDLGVQRGVVRWFLSLHTPTTYPLTISPEKLPSLPTDDAQKSKSNGRKAADDEALPVLGEPSGSNDIARPQTPDLSSVPPAPEGLPLTPPKKAGGKGRGKGKAKTKVADDSESEDAVLPPPFTPSINQALNMGANGDVLLLPPPPLPEGLTPGILKSRLDGKKKIKGALLTPKEMEELTDSWRPYRSLGVYYMWALADPPK
ncbi:uncharacterized protein FIBRA_07681 [Fibroporia radiculosa]|uniref:HhH-GPD domain-containing protein n=1 Tax=Fibroporia radiculosa TaxID=599839 RepID=J4IBY3_9APHY|nr:uncharacterized protein FIBRA_07681 [Fibroporia radiculosa]CCM05461.1 predicted protein [Fibroporia radiculosa]